MDFEKVEVSLTEDQKKAIQNLYSLFPGATENFVSSLILRSSLPEPPKSKSPMKQVTLDKWFVKSPKVPKTNEIINRSMSNSNSSTSTTPDSSASNKILSSESSNKALTDEEIIKQMSNKELKISLDRVDFAVNNTKGRSTAQKGQVIENSHNSPGIAEKNGGKSFDLVEKDVTDQSTLFSMSHSVPNKVLIPIMRRSSRHLSVESTEFNSIQPNTVEHHSILKGKDLDNILENKTPKLNSCPANKNVSKVLRKRSKSCLNSDGSSITEKVATVDDLNLLNESRNNESLALNIPQCVSAKQPTCKTRQRSKALSMESTHTTLHLTKQNTGTIDINEGNDLECETPMQISSFINEKVSKYFKSDKQNSVTFSPIHPKSKVALSSQNLLSLPGKAAEDKRLKKTLRTHKQSGATPKMFETIKEGNKPETTEEGNGKSETSAAENPSEKGNKISNTKEGEDFKAIGKMNKKSKKNKKPDRKSETLEELKDEVLEATEKLKELLDISEKPDKEFETIEEGNHVSGEPIAKLEKTMEEEEKSKVIRKAHKKSKKTKKSTQKLETNEKPDEIMETIDKVVQDSEAIEETNKSVAKKAPRKAKTTRRNSKLITENSQVVDVAEISVELGAEAQNEETPMSVDSPLLNKIGTVGSSEADKLTSEDPQCSVASVGVSQAESDEKQKNYEAFCTLQGLCSSLGINMEHLFQSKKLTRRLQSSCKSDACAFIQGHKLKNGQTTPSVYMHDSMEQLKEILKTYE